jgi:hypothetical protein
VKSKFRILAVGAASVLAASITAVPAQSAAGDTYGFQAFAGGTKITAVGTTVTSDLTAESSIAGQSPASDDNKVASVSVFNLAYVGAVQTSTTAVPVGDGFAVTSTARTANVNLLNGLIKVKAIETVATATSDGTSTPTAGVHTRFVDLNIAGKTYPIDLPDNTGITIPGIASVRLNTEISGVKDDSALAMGTGLTVTLLKARGNIAAGAEIQLNPVFAYAFPTKRGDGAQLGGAGFGAYINADVADGEINASTGILGGKPMPAAGTGGETLSNTTARVNIPGVLNVGGIESTVTGISSSSISDALVTSKLAGLQLFPSLTGALISADAIGSRSHASVTEANGGQVDGSFQFVHLRIAGKLIPIDVPPNTTIDVAGLGKVTLNEHTSVEVPGFVHGYQVIGLHVVLDTKRAGLPIGAEIQIGTSQALVWQ